MPTDPEETSTMPQTIPTCREVGCVGGHPEDQYHRDGFGQTIPDDERRVVPPPAAPAPKLPTAAELAEETPDQLYEAQAEADRLFQASCRPGADGATGRLLASQLSALLDAELHRRGLRGLHDAPELDDRTMTRAEWDATPKDYRLGDPRRGTAKVLRLQDNGATALVPVEVIEP